MGSEGQEGPRPEGLKYFAMNFGPNTMGKEKALQSLRRNSLVSAELSRAGSGGRRKALVPSSEARLECGQEVKAGMRGVP